MAESECGKGRILMRNEAGGEDIRTHRRLSIPVCAYRHLHTRLDLKTALS